MAFFLNPKITHQSINQGRYVRDFNNKLNDTERIALLEKMLVENFDLAIKCILCCDKIKAEEREMAISYLSLYPNHKELRTLIETKP
jgi:hypothetical protein